MVNAAIFERMPYRFCRTHARPNVGNLEVDPEHRRRGAATALMDAVVDWCRREGMERIVLKPSEMSRPFSCALGFRAEEDLMRLDL